MNLDVSIADEYESSDSEDSSEEETLNQDSSSPSAHYHPKEVQFPENDSDESEDEQAPIPSQEPPSPKKLITPSYSIVGDNIDKSIKPRYQRIGTGNRQIQ